MGSNQTLGQCNNNPLNIRYSELNKWRGQSGQNKGFCVFSANKWGYRAAFITLRTYSKRGINTIRKIISTFAPATENDTLNYIRYVVSRTGISPDAPLIFSFLHYAPVITAMAKMESNTDVTREELQDAFDAI